jgi:acyl-lipid omega-6 desaturase (Delta-12 desaturase)
MSALTATLTSAFHEARGLWYHGAALLYGVGGYALGLAGLFSGNPWINAGAVLLLGHAMTICAYMIHECGHNTVFRSNEANARLGRFLNWICGTSYGTFEDIRYKHFRHHMDNDDAVWFVHEAFIARHPRLAQAIQLLEWFYIPAHDMIMHFITMFGAFIIPQRRDQIPRNVVVLLLRGGLFFAVLFHYPKAALLYLVAYLIMMHILRFKDGVQHDYDGNPTLYEQDPPSRFGGRATEQAHTFSNPECLRWDWPNYFTLCFGFHNAHHQRPTVPWYRLPAYHREQFGTDPSQVIPFRTQLKMYHRYRVQRVTHSGGDLDDLPPAREAEYLARARAGRIYGGNAVSFLNSF